MEERNGGGVQGVPAPVEWDLFANIFNSVPDDAWVCINTLFPADNNKKWMNEIKKTIRNHSLPYDHTTTGVRTDKLFVTGGPVRMQTRTSGAAYVYAYPDPQRNSTKKSTLLLLRPRDAQELLVICQPYVRRALVDLMRNVVVAL
jgi:hypothetical protein